MRTVRVLTVEERERAARPAMGETAPSVPRIVSQPAPSRRRFPRVAVVGNGPSSAGQGAEIDGCDFVVRLNTWWKHFPKGEAGRKISAWCFWPPVLAQGLEHYGKNRPELWYSIPHSDLLSAPGQRINGRQYAELARELEKLVKKHGRSRNSLSAFPSTGLVAVAMALPLAGQELLISGFDATTSNAPGWGDNVQAEAWGKQQGHDYLAEKRLLARWVESRKGLIRWIRG